MNDKKAQTRERILQAASNALIQRGPVEPSVSEVMGAAGLTVGGFYAHFGSKEELLRAAILSSRHQRKSDGEHVMNPKPAGTARSNNSRQLFCTARAVREQLQR